ncbi:MAG TPA: hypothetical protein VGI10_15615 [Polyangiaceae bacterium]|jgi:hypothetical protein
MAIDFMIMPLSRYLAGDFITPMMAFAWERGVPYTVIGPDGRREIPRDTPFGGSRAPEQRQRYLPLLQEDLAGLPAPISTNLWDETSEVMPEFYRVDPESYQNLLTEADEWRPRPRLLGLLRRTDKPAVHVGASLFLPVDFTAPFALSVGLERIAGSVPIALKQLAAGGFSDATRSARATLIQALRAAARLRLPLIVDW